MRLCRRYPALALVRPVECAAVRASSDPIDHHASARMAGMRVIEIAAGFHAE